MSEVLAKIAGEAITEEQFEVFLQSVPAEQRAYLSNPQARQYYLDQFIAVRLFSKLGEDSKLDETEEFAEIMAGIRKDILAQLAMKEVLGSIKADEEEVKAFYEANKEQFVKGGKVSAKHILVEDGTKCVDIKKQILDGTMTFESAAMAYSTCPSGKEGGNLGEFGKGQMVKEFEDAAFAGEIGAVIGPVKTQFGFHLIKVESRTEPVTAAFEEVKENIRQNLVGQKQSEVYNAKVEELKAKYMA